MQARFVDAVPALPLIHIFHESEYVSDHFKCREYLSGFTGSAATVVVTMDEAGLWTCLLYTSKRKGCCSGRRIPLPGSGLKKVHEKGGAGQNMRI